MKLELVHAVATGQMTLDEAKKAEQGETTKTTKTKATAKAEK